MQRAGKRKRIDLAELVEAIMGSSERRRAIAARMTIDGEPELATFIQRPDVSEFVKTFVEMTIGDGVSTDEIEGGILELHRALTARAGRLRSITPGL